ncbi:protein S100-B-like [Tachyglossus aculeatus]|uniref:protein S100-B-like n=1 Tax=Tachyglossus aculeatus TaxID=9261 RepID=UPI0018F2ED7C|nr:protein S100-B-like [Tachyglossus aculeatus]
MSASRVSQVKTPTEKAMFDIIDVFHKFSERGGYEDGLEKKEFEDMIHQEAPHFYEKVVKTHENLEKIYKKANVDGNKWLCFKEVVMVLSSIANDSHNRSHQEENPCEGSNPTQGRPGQAPSQGHDHGHEGHGHGHSHRH